MFVDLMFTKGEKVSIFITTILYLHFKLQIGPHDLPMTGPFDVSWGADNFGSISSVC
jgi:hypothetical protein